MDSLVLDCQNLNEPIILVIRLIFYYMMSRINTGI